MIKRVILVVGIQFAFLACAGFSYRYYGLDLPRYDGMLLGEKPKDDVPFSRCEPDEMDRGKCVVMFVSEFEKMRRDMVETKERLKACEKGKK